MSREPILILLGTLIAISPFVGMHPSWFTFFLPIVGLLIAVIGFTLNQKKKQLAAPPHETSSSVGS
jgi:hypothetical protein